MRNALRKHWPEYLIEAFCLGIFMISAGAFTVLFEDPHSLVHQAIGNPDIRRALIGLAMGLTAIGLIYSPWGQQSGAHMNPAVTLAFFRLGKVPKWDAVFYIIFQFIGGLLGVVLTRLALGSRFADRAVNYVVTVPGVTGVTVAFAAELLISCGLMLMILFAINTPKLARYTGLFAGTLVALYVTFEAPFSGMSINPARTVASALPSGVWTAVWIYFVAPIGGMLLAVEIRQALVQGTHLACAKLHHHNDRRCIFCGFAGNQKKRPACFEQSES